MINLIEYDVNILKKLQEFKKDLITIDTDNFNSPKEFDEGTVFKIEEKDWGEEFLPSFAVYLCDDVIGIVADDKFTVADICSNASDIEYVPGETYARYLGTYTDNNFHKYHIAQIIFKNEPKEIHSENYEIGGWISRFDLQARDYVKLLNLIYEYAENNRSAEEIVEIVKERKLYKLR